MRRSQQAFSAPSKQTQSSNAKDELSSTASINASSTTLIPSSKLLASKPRDCTLKREQNSCYEHDNGLMACIRADSTCSRVPTKLCVIIYNLAHQLFNQLLADRTVLAARQFCHSLCNGSNHFVSINHVWLAACRRIFSKK